MYNHLLDIFKCVADEGSINKASKKLYTSPVSVYKSINKLEEELGTSLFIRNKDGCHLTNKGKKVYDSFIRIKDISDSLIKEIADDTTFNIYVPLLMSNDIKEVISSIKINAKYDLLTLEDYRLNELITEHKLGNNFCFGINDHYQDVKYDFYYLGDLSLMLNVPKTSKLANLDKITFNDVKNEKLLFLKEGIFKSFDMFCQSLKHECKDIVSKEYKFFSDSSITNFIKEGYCFVSIGVFNVPNENYVAIPFDCVFKIPYGLYYDKEEISKHIPMD